MSCFVVSDFDIDILVTAYAGLNRPGAKLLNLTRVGRALLLENVASFAACYRVHERPKGHEMRSTMAQALAQARAYRFTRRRARPAAIAKLAQAYDYQACEHEAWAASPARAITLALMARYPDTLPGYDDMPWGVANQADLARVSVERRSPSTLTKARPNGHIGH